MSRGLPCWHDVTAASDWRLLQSRLGRAGYLHPFMDWPCATAAVDSVAKLLRQPVRPHVLMIPCSFWQLAMLLHNAQDCCICKFQGRAHYELLC